MHISATANVRSYEKKTFVPVLYTKAAYIHHQYYIELAYAGMTALHFLSDALIDLILKPCVEIKIIAERLSAIGMLLDILKINSILQTFLHAVESASQWRVVVEWWQRWLPNYYQWPAGGPLAVMRRLGTDVASHHYPASCMRPKADPVPLGLAEWWLQVGCWRLKPVRQNISRHRGGREDKRVGSVAACRQRSAGGPPCNPPLSHPVGEGQLADQWQLASGGPLVGRWCYICRVFTFEVLKSKDMGIHLGDFLRLLLLKDIRETWPH